MSIRPSLYAASLATMLLVLTYAADARACAVDNVASLSANGVPAMLAAAPPIAGRLWAPFVLAQAVAPNASVRFEEARADLVRSLPAAVWTAPFRWVFGDGTTALGHTAVHHYARPGEYHLLIYGYYPSERRWITFDGALVRVVPADHLLRANLEYETLRTVIALVRFTLPVDGVLVVAVLILLAHLQRRLHASRVHDALMETR